MQLGWSSVQIAGSRTKKAQERSDQCGNHHHSRELLVMGIVLLEIC